MANDQERNKQGTASHNVRACVFQHSERKEKIFLFICILVVRPSYHLKEWISSLTAD